MNMKMIYGRRMHIAFSLLISSIKDLLKEGKFA